MVRNLKVIFVISIVSREELHLGKRNADTLEASVLDLDI